MNPPGIWVTMYPQKKDPWIIPTVSGSQSNWAFCGKRQQGEGNTDTISGDVFHQTHEDVCCHSPEDLHSPLSPPCCLWRLCGCWPYWRWPRPGYIWFQRRCRSQCQREWRWCSVWADQSTCSPPRASPSPPPAPADPPPTARWSRHSPASSQELWWKKRETLQG